MVPMIFKKLSAMALHLSDVAVLAAKMLFSSLTLDWSGSTQVLTSSPECTVLKAVSTRIPEFKELTSSKSSESYSTTFRSSTQGSKPGNTQCRVKMTHLTVNPLSNFLG